MTTYIVHLYREMRLSYTGIEADTPDAAATIASGKATDDADNVEDCDGANLAALVDVAGDEHYHQSVMIDFEPERHRKTAPALLAELIDAERFIAGFEDDECQEGINDRLARIRAAIAEAKAANVNPGTCSVHSVTIEVRGGIVQDVSNVPPGWDYEIIDYDNAE